MQQSKGIFTFSKILEIFKWKRMNTDKGCAKAEYLLLPVSPQAQ